MSTIESPRRPRVLYLQFTNPEAYPPLEHSSHLLADAGCDVRFLATAAPGTEGVTFARNRSVEVRRSNLRRHPNRQHQDYLRYAFWALWQVMTWRPDWVYASDPIIAPIALLLSIAGVPVIYHEHDAPIDTGSSRAANAFGRARELLVRRTALNVVPNRDRGALLPPAGRPPTVVQNCPSVNDIVTRADRTGEPLRLVYHGSLGPDKLPFTVVEAMGQLTEPVELHVIGYEPAGSAGFCDRLLEEAARFAIPGSLHIHGAMPRKRLLELGATCDVGVMLTPMEERDANYRAMVGASNKAFDYLASGLAMLVSRTPQWENAFVTPGLARSCDPEDPSSIAEALHWFLAHREDVARMGEAGQQLIRASWNYEHQFAPVKALVMGSAARAVPIHQPTLSDANAGR